jgi:hypothetical protein
LIFHQLLAQQLLMQLALVALVEQLVQEAQSAATQHLELVVRLGY